MSLNISLSLFSSSNVFILGLFSSTEIVGFYSVAEKVVKAVTGLTGPIGSAIYPRVSGLFAVNEKNAMNFLKKVLLLCIFPVVVLCLILLFGSNLITELLLRNSHHEVVNLMRIMSFIPLFVFLDNFYGTQIMINLGMRKQFMKCFLFTGVLSLILSLIFVPRYFEWATATLYLFSQFSLLLMMMFYVNKSGYHLIRKYSRNIE